MGDCQNPWPWTLRGCSMLRSVKMGLQEENVEQEILTLIGQNNWQKLLTHYDRNKFLPWIWPDFENLLFLAQCVLKLKAERVVSIGCGSGLLEWLIQHATGLAVKAVEVDRSWWTSKHCISFLPLEFAQDFSTGYSAATENDALLFCYFNNEPAFLDYVDKYRGPCIIGPGDDRGTHTAPNPFHLPETFTKTWKLHALQELNSKNDFIVIFQRNS